MRRERKVAQRSRGVGGLLRNNIDEQTSERNISIAAETVAYEGNRRKTPSLFLSPPSVSFYPYSPFDFNLYLIYSFPYKHPVGGRSQRYT